MISYDDIKAGRYLRYVARFIKFKCWPNLPSYLSSHDVARCGFMATEVDQVEDGQQKLDVFVLLSLGEFDRC